MNYRTFQCAKIRQTIMADGSKRRLPPGKRRHVPPQPFPTASYP
ncbi:hypothetical protein OKW38_006148 [Paraburkholderia sp. MM5496-R1]